MANEKTILKFYRGAAPQSPDAGMIWFDKANSTIKVYTGADWESYAGKLIDATWDEKKKALTLVKQDGKSKEISFADVASAASLEQEIKDRKAGDAALVKKIDDLAAVKHVDSLGGKTGAIAVDGEGSGDYKVKLAMTDQKLGATITGLGTAAGQNVEAFDRSGAADDVKTALVGGATDDYNTLGKLETKIKAAQSAADNAQATADAKVKSVEGTNTVIATTTEHAVSVSLKTSDKGNVKFTQDIDGLSANVTIPEATVTGVKADDKFLSLADKLVSADVSIAYDAADKKIYLYGKDKNKANAVSSIDCRDFIKDGMLTDAELVTNPAGQSAGTYIKLTWNTDGGKQPMYIDVTSLIDIYTAKPDGGLKLEDHAFSVDTTKIATVESVNGVTNRVSTLEGKVTTIEGEGEGSIKKAVADEASRAKAAEKKNADAAADAQKTIDDFKGRTEGFATAAQGAKADSAIQSIAAMTGDKYITATRNGTSVEIASKGIDSAIKTAADAVKVSVKGGGYITGSADATGRVITLGSTTQTIAEANSTAKGLAEASDVKNYVAEEIEKVTKFETLNSPDKVESGKFVTAVSQTNGIITVSRAALVASDIPEIGIAKVTGLQVALDGKATSAQGKKADTAIQEVTASGDAYVTATATKTGTSVEIKVNSSAMKTYVDNKIANNTDLVWASFE